MFSIHSSRRAKQPFLFSNIFIFTNNRLDRSLLHLMLLLHSLVSNTTPHQTTNPPSLLPSLAPTIPTLHPSRRSRRRRRIPPPGHPQLQLSDLLMHRPNQRQCPFLPPFILLQNPSQFHQTLLLLTRHLSTRCHAAAATATATAVVAVSVGGGPARNSPQ